MLELMRAVVLDKDMRLYVKDVPVPNLDNDLIAPKKYDTSKTLTFPKEELVLLEVKAASICGTDLHILERTHGSAPPVILGHEYVGKVVEVEKSVQNVKPGDFVGVDPNIKCGLCDSCRENRPNMCSELTTLGIFVDGGFAKYNIAPAKQLYKFNPDLSVDRAVFFEPMTCAVHGLEKVNPQIGDSVLIYGAGPIGCCFAMLCIGSGASRVVVVEIRPFRKRFAKKIGAVAINPGEENNFSQRKGFDITIDAAGISAVVNPAIENTRPGGKILLFGQQNIENRAEINPTLVNQKELQVFGSYAAASSFTKVVKILENLKLEKLITHRFGLDEIHKAFELLRSGKAMEIILIP